MFRLLRFVLKWLNDNQGAMTVIIAIAGACGGLYLFLFPPKPPAPPAEIKHFNVCRGEDRGTCGAADIWIGCLEVASWALDHCSKYDIKTLSVRSGGSCGYRHEDVACTLK